MGLRFSAEGRIKRAHEETSSGGGGVPRSGGVGLGGGTGEREDRRGRRVAPRHRDQHVALEIFCRHVPGVFGVVGQTANT